MLSEQRTISEVTSYSATPKALEKADLERLGNMTSDRLDWEVVLHHEQPPSELLLFSKLTFEMLLRLRCKPAKRSKPCGPGSYLR